VEPLKNLHAERGDSVHFVDVVVRQAHPGPGAPNYHSIEQKLEDGRRYRREQGVPWHILADDLEGTVHQTYGGLADPTYLIDADGKVAFYNMWTYAPALNEALDELLANGGRGVVHGGVDRTPYLLPALIHGWPGIQKGLPQSLVDLEKSFPGTGVGTWVGYQLRPVLGSFAARTRPLSPAARVGLTAGAAALLVFGAVRLARRAK
jgi:hypothetical protein